MPSPQISGRRLPSVVPGVVPPPGLTRHLWAQAVLFKAGDGLFLTGSAVFFVKVIGLTAGRLADRIGTQRVWALGDLLCAVMFLVWPFIGAGWVFQSQLQDPRRRGEYGSAGQLLNGPRRALVPGPLHLAEQACVLAASAGVRRAAP